MSYGSAREFVNDMMKNEGVIFKDYYGREWKYKDYKFYFSDLGEKSFSERVDCLHLFGSGIFPLDEGEG